MRLEDLEILRCPLDSSRLVLDKDSAHLINDYVDKGKLFCQAQNHQFHFEKGVPHLITPAIREQLEWEMRKSRFFLLRKRRGPAPEEKGILLSEEDSHLIKQIQAMDKMASGYRKYVVDSFEFAPNSAVFYERYEDLWVRDLVQKNMKKSKEEGVGVVLIEVGSGPGRYLIQYGGKIKSDKFACEKYRNHPDMGRFYSYDKEYANNLKLIVGIDFSQEMINSALQWIHENNLDDLLYEGRILMLKAIAQYLELSFDSTPFKDSYKVVTCVFQTLGNQLDRNLQVKMLRKMCEFAKPHGTILVSVFNKDVFLEYLPKYYEKIEPSIGEIISSEKERELATLRTKWGVYSRWFHEMELRNLFIEASRVAPFGKLADVEIKSGDKLPLFAKDTDYLSREVQKAVRRRGIIATVEL